MNSKKIVFIFLAICILIFIIVIAFFTGRKKTGNNSFSFASTPTPLQKEVTSVPQFSTSTLSMQKHTGKNQIDVIINAGTKPVSAVQLDISYDPQILTNVTVAQGNFFDNPISLGNSVNANSGNIFYALGVRSKDAQKFGQGIIATISYTPNVGITSQTNLQFLPRTEVTTLGVANSILKEASGLTLQL